MSMLTSAAPAVVRVLRRSSRLSARTQLLAPSAIGGRTAAAGLFREASSSGRSCGTSFRIARQVRTSASAAAGATTPPAKAPASVEGAINGFTNRQRINTLLSGADGGASRVGEKVTVRGWVRTVRNQKQFAFIEVNDGSCLSGIQVVLNADTPSFELVTSNAVTTGASIVVHGVLVASPGGKQSVEVKADTLSIVGTSDAEKYPLQKKRHTLEFLRGIAHLRPRTNTIGAVARVRNALAYATHNFFQSNGFVYVHTPIITASDCEGAGEQFAVTTLMGDPSKPLFPPAGGATPAAPPAAAAAGSGLEDLKVQVAKQGEVVRAAKAAKAENTAAEVEKLLALKAQLASAEAAAAAAAAPAHAAGGSGLPLLKDGRVDYSKDFFGKAAFLTVSGQLNGEIYASALGDIYTFGPTFRAENSNTSRHLAEFWMVEPELSFADLTTDMDCAEAYLKHCLRHLLATCDADLDFFERTTAGLRERLQTVVDRPFARITYTEAVDELQKAIKGGRKFEYPVEWGRDLQSEHERFLTEEVHKGTPVIVYNYPVQCKAFYMRLNDDNKTVAAMDVLVPRVGELMGGSQREERLDVLERRLESVGLDKETYWWYLDLRRYGSVPHAGFGLGFERLVQYATGVENIRDVIPFPRHPGYAEF